MLLLVFYYCNCPFLSVAVEVSTHPCVICCHFCCPMSLFQGDVVCQNFTFSGPDQCMNSGAQRQFIHLPMYSNHTIIV